MRNSSVLLLCGFLFLLLVPAGCKDKNAQQAVFSDGVEIHYTAKGQGSPAIVFVHGWCCDEEVWKYQVPYFAKNHKVVTIDLGGYGQSDLGRDNWTMEMFGRDVKAVVDKLKLEKIVLVGHSMGGPVIVAAQQLMPEKVVALVGADTFHNIEKGYTGEQMAVMIANFERDFRTQVDIFARQMFPPSADANLVDWIANKMSSANQEVAISSLRSLGQYSLIEPLQQTDVPVYSIRLIKNTSNRSK
jgi:pimeloyl-ACP methyl ester carboxylesterase